MLRDKLGSGWIALGKTIDSFLVPHPTKSTFQPWDASSDEPVSTIRSITTASSFWEKLSTHYSAENHSEVVLQDNVCLVKSICESDELCRLGHCSPACVVQLLDDEPWDALRPTLEELLANKDKNKQRAAAEFIAGIISGPSPPTISRLSIMYHLQARSTGLRMRRRNFGIGSHHI